MLVAVLCSQIAFHFIKIFCAMNVSLHYNKLNPMCFNESVHEGLGSILIWTEEQVWEFSPAADKKRNNAVFVSCKETNAVDA